jgi:myo-inositol-1(or 4)-monophosphatase
MMKMIGLLQNQSRNHFLDGRVFAIDRVVRDAVSEIWWIISKRSEERQSKGGDCKINLDLYADSFLKKELSCFPAPVFSEEDFDADLLNHIPAEDFFLVDPLDGSFNRHWDAGPFAVGVAYIEQGQLAYGCIGYLSDSEWRVISSIGPKSLNKASGSYIYSGFPLGQTRSMSELEKYHMIWKNYDKVRMIGSALVSIAKLIEGSASCYYERGIKYWDVLPGIAIAREHDFIIQVSELDARGICSPLEVLIRKPA